MNTLTYPELQRLADLQVRLLNLSNEISHVKKVMGQLTTDSCSVELQFKVHNQSVCDNNRTLHGLAVLLGHAVEKQKPTKKAECLHEVKHLFEESSGLRMLHQVLQEKEIIKEQLHKEAEDLLQKLIPSPTQIRYHEHF